MATLVRWEPFRELAALQNEMSRYMNGLLEGNGHATQSWVPTADVWATSPSPPYCCSTRKTPNDAPVTANSPRSTPCQ